MQNPQLKKPKKVIKKKKKKTFSAFVFCSETNSLLTQPNQHLFFAIEDV
jgi:hypothetical protein